MKIANSNQQKKHSERRWLILIGGTCSLLLWCAPAHSQTLGRISGIVTDTSGGAVSGATVSVTDVARSVTRTVTTDATGTYSAVNLLPSTYSVHAVYMGFKAFDRQDIELGVGGDVHVDVTLQPGEQTQTVTVTGDVPTITTTNAQLATTITGQTLADLPVAGHNWVQMLALLPTYQLRQGSATGPNQYSNGVRAEYNVYVLDGVTDFMTYYTTGPVNVGYTAGGPEQATMLPTDSIQEFNVVQNSKAEYGWRPGAQINVGIKSGTNAIHGTAFASGRSTGLTDRNAFGTFIPPVSFEDFDATIGGPIKKDKLFYLLGYEGQRGNVGNPKVLTEPTLQSTGSSTNSVPDAINALIAAGVTPNPAMMALAGCTTSSTVATPQPASTLCTPNKGVFANSTASTTFPVDYTATTKTDNGIGRVDYHLNDHHNFSGEIFDGDGFGLIPLNATQGYWSVPLEAHVILARGMWTWVPNSNWVQDLRFGWDSMIAFSNTGSYDCPSQPAPFGNFTDNQWVPGAGAPNYATSFGFVSGGQPACGSGNNSAFPTMTITGFTTSAQSATLGGAGGSFTTSGIERWVDSVSWTHGNHITKFGGDFMLAHGTPVLNVQNYKGTLNFNNNIAALNAFAGATPLDNFIAGIVTSTSIQVGAVSRQFTYHGIAGFIQDDWRIFPRLTVNLGLRYENTSTIHEVNGLIGNVNLGSPTGVTQQGQGGPLYKLDPWGFAPRFGLAWDVTGKGTTVLRTGFNIAYQNPTIQAFITPGMTLIPAGINLSNGAKAITEGGTINTQNLIAFNPPSKTAATIVAGQPFFGGNLTNLAGTCSPTVPCAIGGAASHLDMPMILNWSFGVQHAITNSLTLDVNYVGTHGQHLFDFSDINQPAPGSNATTGAFPANENSRRPLSQYPWFSQIKVLGAITNVSWYHGLQAILTQRTKYGLSFIATYAYAHAMDSGSSDLTPLVPENSLAPQNEYGNSTYDLRHRFTFGPSYEIPGKPGFGQMLRGWQVASTVKVFAGFPINPIDAADDISGTGEGQDRWDLIGNAHDFNGFGNAAPIPCFYNPAGNPGTPNTSAFSKSGCTAGLPAACTNAAATEPGSPVGTGITAPGNTAVFELNKLGCYMKGNSVIIPPAPGTFGTMSRDEIYSIGTWEWDASVVKGFKFGERISAQFRADFYNVTNTTFFAAASATLSSPSTFGASASTPDVNSPFVGTGGPRKIQLALKLLF